VKCGVVQEEHYKSALHPGLLAELEALGALLVRDTLNREWVARARATKERILEIVRLVAARYRRDGDTLEAVVLQVRPTTLPSP
jgi:hypothetical protein